MPSYNLTLDDTSPLWTYSGVWKDQDKTDGWYSLYANTTFHATNQTGASVRIGFNGTGVYLYGAFRDNHDDYAVSLDGQGTIGNSFAPLPNDEKDFQRSLFGRAGLDPGFHEIVLTDLSSKASAPWLDLDFGVITLGDGNETTNSTDIMMDDIASNITYNGSWDDSPNEFSQLYHDQTLHRVSNLGATATVTFYGHAATVYGATSMNHGTYTVSLDGGAAQPYNGLSAYFHAQQILYAASSLELALHIILITNTGQNQAFLDLDYIVVSTWATTTNASAPSSAPSVPTSGTSGTSNTSLSSNRTPVGAIVGGTIGSLLVLLGFVLLVILFLRQRRHIRGAFAGKSERVPSPYPAPGPPITNLGPGVAVSGLGVTGATDAWTRYGVGENQFVESTPGSGGETASNTFRGSYGGNRGAGGHLQPLIGHVDSPPPGYGQILGRSDSSPSSGPSSAAPAATVTSNVYANELGYVSLTKSSAHPFAYSGRRPLPTTPP